MARILVVEDEEPIRRMFGQLLAGEGHLVVTAADGHDGLVKSILLVGQIDLILTDYNMSSLNGLQMIVAMQAAICLPPRAIIMSGDFTSESFKNQIGQTLRHVLPPTAKLNFLLLPKPVMFEKLLETVSALLAGPVE